MHPNTNLVPDADGHYTVVLSNFGMDAVHGAKLPMSDALLEKLQARIRGGGLRGEYGHPKKLETVPMTLDRMMSIDESRVAIQICALDAQMVDYPDAVDGKFQRVTAKIKLAGPFGPTVKEQIENHPERPLCFGLRAMTTFVRSIGEDKNLVKIEDLISWDIVEEDPYTHGLR